MKRYFSLLLLVSSLTVFGMEQDNDNNNNEAKTFQEQIIQQIVTCLKDLQSEVTEMHGRIIGKNFETLVSPESSISEEEYRNNITAVWEKEKETLVSVKESIFNLVLNESGKNHSHAAQMELKELLNNMPNVLSEDQLKDGFMNNCFFVRKVYSIHNANKKKSE